MADVTGCRDDAVTWLEPVAVPPDLRAGWQPLPRPAQLVARVDGEDVTSPVTATARVDVAATARRWLLPTRYDALVPPAQLIAEIPCTDE
ncbi:MAG: hypothetical protein J7503_16770, partial [Cellulomonas iranensis]|uniref:hypothetical protein n=1 Tax=Cellulomonas iranensis TaxID=76862 RepID=UPI001B2E1C82